MFERSRLVSAGRAAVVRTATRARFDQVHFQTECPSAEPYATLSR